MFESSMFPQVYRRDNASTAASTSTSPTLSSSTPSPSTSSSSGGPFSKGSSSSFFTFLVALLILVLASGALVVRAIYLRRRFRNQVQAAIDAGLLNPNKLPVPQTKPEMHEIYVRSLSNDALEWENFLPISAITLDEPILQFSDKESKLILPPSQLTLRQRLTNVLRRSPIPSSHHDDISNEYSTTQRADDSMTTSQRVQVAVLIAMPSEHPSIHPLYEEVDTGDDDAKGKRRDSSLHDDSIPDVIFGISSLPFESSKSFSK